ncbi:MAG: GNAT family N-acetyltransferase, partial [Beijerinckiaceae bacterium]
MSERFTITSVAALSIRTASAADLVQIRDVLVTTWHATYDAIYGREKVTEITGRWHSIDNLARQIDQPLQAFLVAEYAGTVQATASAAITRDGLLKLNRLYVRPESHRQGIGRLMLDEVFARFPLAFGCELEVEPQNRHAVAFYARHGFDLAGDVSNCGGDSGVGAKIMRRQLADAEPAKWPAIMLRPVEDRDAQDLIGMITLCFAEYPGCYFDPHGDMPDIVRPAQSRTAQEVLFLVVEDVTGRICACIGVDFPEVGIAELHRLYVRPDMRGRGLAKLLTKRMETFARSRGAGTMVLTSDTRFTKAHALYEGLGYMRGSATRSCGDISQSREF